VLVSVAVILSACAQAAPQQTTNAAGYNEITSSGITLQWKVVAPNLDIIVTAPTKGWVAVGFSTDGMMKGANLILAKVENGVAVAEDDFGYAVHAHASDVSLGGVDNVTNLTGTESATQTQTEMGYTIPLDSGDQYDLPLAQGTTYKVLLSYSTSDDFTVKHALHTSVAITL
jgi:hypothetical protein